MELHDLRPWVELLHQNGLRAINTRSLRETLADAAFAREVFPNVKASIWDKLLRAVREHCERRKLSTELVEFWLATRWPAALKAMG